MDPSPSTTAALSQATNEVTGWSAQMYSAFVSARESRPVALDGRDTDFGCIHNYDLPAPRRNALSQPQVWPVSRSQMGELRLWGDSSVHSFASAVVAGASIAGLRG